MKKTVFLYTIIVLGGLLTASYSHKIPRAISTASALTETQLSSFDPLAKYQTHWCYPYLKDLTTQGLINGDGNGNYEIDQELTTGEFLTVLAQINDLSLPEIPSYEKLEAFITPSGSWQENITGWALANQITDTNTVNGFTQPITRGTAAVILRNFLSLSINEELLQAYTPMVKDYPDMELDQKSDAMICCVSGLISGDDGYLRLEAPLKRSESFVLFSKLIHPEMRIQPVLAPVFYAIDIPLSIKEQMFGKTYHETAKVPVTDLKYLRLSYIGYDGQSHVGEMVVHRLVAEEVTEIFKELYEMKYPIEKMQLPDFYDGLDEASMQDNNTSAFNDRYIAGSSARSYHQFGLAIDINPLYNPYYNANTKLLQPQTAADYLDRNSGREEYLLKDDACYNAFIRRGWEWGGDWRNPKDYQHFEKKDILDIYQ